MHHRILSLIFAACCLFLITNQLLADGAGDNDPRNVRAVPQLGIELKPEDKAELEAGLAKLEAAIAELATRKESQRLLPDVEIFARAVRDGVKYRELFSQ